MYGYCQSVTTVLGVPAFADRKHAWTGVKLNQMRPSPDVSPVLFGTNRTTDVFSYTFTAESSVLRLQRTLVSVNVTPVTSPSSFIRFARTTTNSAHKGIREHVWHRPCTSPSGPVQGKPGTPLSNGMEGTDVLAFTSSGHRHCRLMRKEGRNVAWFTALVALVRDRSDDVVDGVIVIIFVASLVKLGLDIFG